jgi:hypothetical protein
MFMNRNLRWSLAIFLLPALSAACSSSSSSPGDPKPASDSRLRIVTVSGAPMVASAGDALALKIVEVAADGSTSDLPAGAKVVWTAPDVLAALAPNTQAPSLVPPSATAPGYPPSAAWIDNTARTDRNGNLASVLFVFDPGTIQNAAVKVAASVSGGAASGDVEAGVVVWPTPAGNATRGKTLYGESSANCARCHGPSGHGSLDVPQATAYTIAGETYAYPAPGINAESGNLASDPNWNAALFAVAARADIDNHGVALRTPMPDWLTHPVASTGQPLATQDFADIYAFLRTQTQ